MEGKSNWRNVEVVDMDMVVKVHMDQEEGN